MKVVFLDFDGVINNIHKNEMIDKKAVDELRKVIKKTGAKVVVTSFRKNELLESDNKKLEETTYYRNFLKPLKAMGIDFYDYTPYIEEKDIKTRREKEIIRYLEHHKEIEEYVIIEDDFLMQTLYDHQVWISNSEGFSSKYVLPTIEILNGNLGFYPPEYDRGETFEERIERLFPNTMINNEIKDKKLEKLLSIQRNKK